MMNYDKSMVPDCNIVNILNIMSQMMSMFTISNELFLDFYLETYLVDLRKKRHSSCLIHSPFDFFHSSTRVSSYVDEIKIFCNELFSPHDPFVALMLFENDENDGIGITTYTMKRISKIDEIYEKEIAIIIFKPDIDVRHVDFNKIGQVDMKDNVVFLNNPFNFIPDLKDLEYDKTATSLKRHKLQIFMSRKYFSRKKVILSKTTMKSKFAVKMNNYLYSFFHFILKRDDDFTFLSQFCNFHDLNDMMENLSMRDDNRYIQQKKINVNIDNVNDRENYDTITFQANLLYHNSMYKLKPKTHSTDVVMPKAIEDLLIRILHFFVLRRKNLEKEKQQYTSFKNTNTDILLEFYCPDAFYLKSSIFKIFNHIVRWEYLEDQCLCKTINCKFSSWTYGERNMDKYFFPFKMEKQRVEMEEENDSEIDHVGKKSRTSTSREEEGNDFKSFQLTIDFNIDSGSINALLNNLSIYGDSICIIDSIIEKKTTKQYIMNNVLLSFLNQNIVQKHLYIRSYSYFKDIDYTVMSPDIPSVEIYKSIKAYKKISLL